MDETQPLGRLCGNPAFAARVGEGGRGTNIGLLERFMGFAVSGNISSSLLTSSFLICRNGELKGDVESGVLGCTGMSGEIGVGGRTRFIVLDLVG